MSIAKIRYYLSGLFRIISAAMTPGTHPQIHNIKTIRIEPHPFPITAKGGQIIARITLQKLISNYFNDINTNVTSIAIIGRQLSFFVTFQ